MNIHNPNLEPKSPDTKKIVEQEAPKTPDLRTAQEQRTAEEKKNNQ